MSDLITVEGFSRREALRRIALAVFAAGAVGEMDPLAAQHVHDEAGNLKGALDGYQRQFFTEHEWKTLTRLAGIILPADDKSPSAVDAGAPEFIDLLCSANDDLGAIYTGGIAWLDAEMRHRYGKDFLGAGNDEQTAMLDALVEEESRFSRRPAGPSAGPYGQFRDYRAGDRPQLGAGVAFFDWVRKMTVDAYYTSPAGVADLGYQGDQALSSYQVPQEAIDYAMSRSPFASDD
jgi:hypothetical protein